MVMRRLARFLALFVSLVPVACQNRSQGGSGALTIAVVPKGTSHAFWQSIHAGAAKAGKELGVTIVWRGPLREDERESQISEVERFVTSGVSGIVLAPLDEVALAQPVADAKRNGIPVVVIDSGLKGNDYVSFVATDNRLAGRLAADHLATLLHDRGRIVLLRYAEGSESTIQREEGFLEAVRAHAGLQIVSANQYGGADVEGAYKKSEALLSGLKRSDGSLDVDGIFTPNESTTLAMMRVLADNGWAGKVRFIGFDASDTLLTGLRDGQLDAIVVQDPVRMGYEGVKTLVAHIRGQRVDARIDTGVRLVARDHMDDPDVHELLYPDLERWLTP
jgi:ribose transport system substrate-binding protein